MHLLLLLTEYVSPVYFLKMTATLQAGIEPPDWFWKADTPAYGTDSNHVTCKHSAKPLASLSSRLRERDADRTSARDGLTYK